MPGQIAVQVTVSNVTQFRRVMRELAPALCELEENDREAAIEALSHIVRVQVGK